MSKVDTNQKINVASVAQKPALDCSSFHWTETVAAAKPYRVLKVHKVAGEGTAFLVYISSPAASSDFEKIVTCFSAAISGWQTLDADVCQVMLVEGSGIIEDDENAISVQFAQNSIVTGKNGRIRVVQNGPPVRVFPNDKGVPCLLNRLDYKLMDFHVNNEEMITRLSEDR